MEYASLGAAADGQDGSSEEAAAARPLPPSCLDMQPGWAEQGVVRTNMGLCCERCGKGPMLHIDIMWSHLASKQHLKLVGKPVASKDQSPPPEPCSSLLGVDGGRAAASRSRRSCSRRRLRDGQLREETPLCEAEIPPELVAAGIEPFAGIYRCATCDRPVQDITSALTHVKGKAHQSLVNPASSHGRGIKEEDMKNFPDYVFVCEGELQCELCGSRANNVLSMQEHLTHEKHNKMCRRQGYPELHHNKHLGRLEELEKGSVVKHSPENLLRDRLALAKPSKAALDGHEQPPHAPEARQPHAPRPVRSPPCSPGKAPRPEWGASDPPAPSKSQALTVVLALTTITVPPPGWVWDASTCLAVTAGDRVELLDDSDNDWAYGRSNGKEGWLPVGALDMRQSSSAPLVASSSSTSVPSTPDRGHAVGAALGHAGPPIGQGQPLVATITVPIPPPGWTWDPSTCLQVSCGDTVEVLEVDPDWAYGRSGGREGWLPTWALDTRRGRDDGPCVTSSSSTSRQGTPDGIHSAVVGEPQQRSLSSSSPRGHVVMAQTRVTAPAPGEGAPPEVLETWMASFGLEVAPACLEVSSGDWVELLDVLRPWTYGRSGGREGWLPCDALDVTRHRPPTTASTVAEPRGSEAPPAPPATKPPADSVAPPAPPPRQQPASVVGSAPLQASQPPPPPPPAQQAAELPPLPMRQQPTSAVGSEPLQQQASKAPPPPPPRPAQQAAELPAPSMRQQPTSAVGSEPLQQQASKAPPPPPPRPAQQAAELPAPSMRQQPTRAVGIEPLGACQAQPPAPPPPPLGEGPAQPMAPPPPPPPPPPLQERVAQPQAPPPPPREGVASPPQQPAALAQLTPDARQVGEPARAASGPNKPVRVVTTITDTPPGWTWHPSTLLQVTCGDFVEVLLEGDDGWAYARAAERDGWLPVTALDRRLPSGAPLSLDTDFDGKQGVQVIHSLTPISTVITERVEDAPVAPPLLAVGSRLRAVQQVSQPQDGWASENHLILEPGDEVAVEHIEAEGEWLWGIAGGLRGWAPVASFQVIEWRPLEAMPAPWLARPEVSQRSGQSLCEGWAHLGAVAQ